MNFTTVTGIHIPEHSLLKEEYQVTTRENGTFHVRFNVSSEKIDKAFQEFAVSLAEPGFLVLETPCNETKEIELRKKDSDPFHRDIYYLDGLSKYDFLKLYSKYSDVFIKDGLVHFGFGSHEEQEEIFVGSYKVFHLYTSDISRYERIFDDFGIKRTEDLITPWDTFTSDSPGSRSRWEEDGIDIFEIIEDLMTNHNLYHAKTIED